MFFAKHSAGFTRPRDGVNNVFTSQNIFKLARELNQPSLCLAPES